MPNIDWESKLKIDEVIEQMALSRVQRFYPTIIHKITDVPLTKTFEYLLDLVQDNRLLMKWEIRCPNFDCLTAITRIDKLEDYISKPIECKSCENEILVSENIIFPVFEFNPVYKERIREIKKKDRNLLKVL